MRDRRRFLASVVAAVVLGVSCAQPPAKSPENAAPDPAAVRADIEAANARFLDAIKKGDLATMMGNYEADALLMMPGTPATSGAAAIEQGLKDFLGQVTVKEGQMTTLDVMVAGDLAIETGTFAWTLTPRKGPAINDKGKYLTVWRHQVDGSWKIIRDINNTDLPAR
jgi:uncharacterized protein (TIGR02246 family)